MTGGILYTQMDTQRTLDGGRNEDLIFEVLSVPGKVETTDDKDLVSNWV